MHISDLASSYDAKDWQKKVTQQVSDEVRQRLKWLDVQWADTNKGNRVKLLDYACGTGSISRVRDSHFTRFALQGKAYRFSVILYVFATQARLNHDRP